MRATGNPVLDVWLLATAPGREPISLHGEVALPDPSRVGEVFDRMAKDLVAQMREYLTAPPEGEGS